MRFTALFVFLFGFYTTLGQNLIVNPGAELPPVGNGWTQVSGFWTRATERTPHGGSYHFYAGDNSLGGSELYQDVNVSAWATSIDLGLSTFSFTVWMTVYDYKFSPGVWNDQASAVVEYRNSVGTVLSTYNTGFQSTTTWVLYSDTRTAPIGTRTIRIRLIAARNYGTAADGYFDDLSLTHSTTLPVSLLSFQGHALDKNIVLSWQTSEEKSNDFFTIEKSENGIDWKTIGTIEGSETSAQLLSYSFVDDKPEAGIQYYRLKQTDMDGTSSYFQVISIDYSSSTKITVFPNPTWGTVNLLTPDTFDGTVRIYSMTGQDVFFQEIGQGNVHTLDINSIAPGVYILEYSGGGGISRLMLRKE
jgi:hypothetical protein